MESHNEGKSNEGIKQLATKILRMRLRKKLSKKLRKKLRKKHRHHLKRSAQLLKKGTERNAINKEARDIVIGQDLSCLKEHITFADVYNIDPELFTQFLDRITDRIIEKTDGSVSNKVDAVYDFGGRIRDRESKAYYAGVRAMERVVAKESECDINMAGCCPPGEICGICVPYGP